MKINLTKTKCVVIFICVSGLFSGIIAGVFFGLTRDLPQIRALESFIPSAVTRIYSSDKVLLAELFQEKRDPVPLKNIPSYLRKALVATEDRKFYEHSGVDIKAIFRAILKDIWAGEFVEGASTITQQLAKTLFLTPEKSLKRKTREALLAFQLERRYTKDEILKFYLNQVYFGSGAYGVESAARIYFNKSVSDLNLSECAMIAGLPKSPSRYSPLVNKELAIQRRGIVLKQMLDTDIITKKDFDQTVEEPFLKESKNTNSLKAPYFVEYIKKNLEKNIGPSRLYRGGLTVYTTLSYKLQQNGERAIENGLSALKKRMNQKKIKDPDPQAALVAVNVATGGILSMIGGEDFHKSPFNRAVSAKRQPGSAFKPIVFAYAVEKGYPQNQLILDAPIAYKTIVKGREWRPNNFSKKYMGEITLRKALTASKNIPAVRLIEKLKPKTIVKFARSMGIDSPLSANLSLALGTSEVTLLNLTSAYAVFPNRGNWIKPFGVWEVIDRRGRIIWRVKQHKKAVMSRAGAAVMTNILSGVVQEGTGKKAKKLRRPIAGKTGTTDQYKDALFIGFSPTVAAGVWTGRDISETLGNLETGARAALPIWIEFMRMTFDDKPIQYFDIPDDVTRTPINPVTGEILPGNHPDAVMALFKKGTEPRK